MTAKRVFQVYQEDGTVGVKQDRRGYVTVYAGKWRFRVIAKRNGKIVAGSQESFDSKGNALRAAKRECALYPAGVAVVEVKE